MNLQENIYRIQGLMTENKNTVIRNMIDKLGLYETIKLVGGFNKFVKNMGGYIELLSSDDKIGFIVEVILYLMKRYNDDGISVWDLDMEPILFGPPDDELQQIEYFNPNFLTFYVYEGENYQDEVGNFTERYEDLDEDTLDDVFMFMVKALDDNK